MHPLRPPVLAALLLASCADPSSPSTPPGPIESFVSVPEVFRPGESVVLRPVFAEGSGRIEPDVGPVESGSSHPVGPSSSGRTYRLVVEVDGATHEASLAIPLRYRERVTPIAAGAGARSRHGATTLSDGRVLIVGGASPGPVSWTTAFVFEPAGSTFAQAGELSATRSGSAVAALPGGGALAFGGQTNESTFEVATRVEEWDPGTSSWTVVGHLVSNRIRHTATRLPDGRVLVAGGAAAGGDISERDAEIWVPGVGSRQPAGEMIRRRAAHTATTLRDGRVLLAGGYDVGTGEGVVEAEIFDPASETFSAAGTLRETRAYHSAVRLGDGRVLLVGGDVIGAGLRRTAEVWDPATGAFTPAGELASPRTEVPAILLGSGEVLVAGGLVEETVATDLVELWDPVTGLFRTSSSRLPTPRVGHSLHLLPDARVLLVGGDPGSGFPSAAAEIID